MVDLRPQRSATNTQRGRFDLPRKVVEMYSDTWFPERLISDKCDSSLFNILLNCGETEPNGMSGVNTTKKKKHQTDTNRESSTTIPL